MAYNMFKSQAAAYGIKKPDGFNPYAAGKKNYNFGRYNATSGPVASKSGYEQRDIETKAKRAALLARMKAGQQGRYASPQYLGGQR